MITQDLQLIQTTLESGGVAAIPTETVYGLAANALNETAIRQIFDLKKRPLNHPLILHVAAQANLQQWVHTIPKTAHMLIDAFWPGPLTLVFEGKTKQVHDCITGHQTSIAIRCPKHPLLQTLLQQLPFPLVAPSANPFGKISPTTAKHVQESFPEANFPILDGGRCPVGIESTIVSIDDESFRILRHGAIDETMIAGILNRHASTIPVTLRVSGNLETHYQPQKPLYCFESIEDMRAFCRHQQQSVYALSFTSIEHIKANLIYQLPQSPAQLAYELYYQLRQADASNAALIVIELPPATQEFAGVRERLSKAGKKLNY